MKLLLCFMFVMVRQTFGVIYRLNASEYQRLPPIFNLDPYEECISEKDGLYCTVDFELVSEEPNELLTVIKEYSKRTYTHFNHSILHYGVCVTKTCDKFLNETALDLNSTLERCYNESLWNKYKLKTKIHKIVSCNDGNKAFNIDGGDIVVAIVILTLLILNLVGSLYGIYCWKNNVKEGNRFILCFSVFSNWSKLVTPSGEGPEGRLRRFKFFNGIKTITTVLVILGHATIAFVMAVQNPQFMEDAYHFLPYHLLYNGHLIVQSFFMMSGFLLAYNIQLLLEKKPFYWTMYPLGIIVRWLRLTPPYAIVLAFTSTWLRHLGSGPLWQTAVGVEIDDCRRYWWMNLLYIHNYFDNTQCMFQTWYLAADMQLFCVGLFICLVLNSKCRKMTLSALIAVGLVIPGVQIYLQDLNPILVVSPEVGRNMFVKDPTFNHVYKRGHTNTTCYLLGIVTAYWVYQLQKSTFDITIYKKYRPIYYALVPFIVSLILLGSIFFIDGFMPPTILRISYFSCTKLLYGLVGVSFIVGTVFKYETTEYQRLPPIFYLDPYEECISEKDGLYCTVDFELVSEEPNELLTVIKEYSKRTYTHFNHSILHHGVCVTKTCDKFLNKTVMDLNSTLERCYNESLWNKYKLKTKIHKIVSCDDGNKAFNIDAGDIVVAIVILTLLTLNLVGSLYGIYCWRNNVKEGNRFILCFSVFRNWSKLVRPSGEGSEERLRRLKFINGLKTITTVLVILGHGPFAYVIAVQNPHYIEKTYHSLPFHLVINGHLIVQSFFMMSGFLLAYNIQLLAEKKKFDWAMLPLGIIVRWLRLTPPYALVLAFTSTWLRHLGSGPLWQTAVGVEIDDCRRDWWMNLLYIHNYFDNTQCMAQTWYLAADMQLFCVGMFICLVLKNNCRKMILAALIAVGLIVPGVQIYLQDLNPTLVLSPEVSRNIFIKDPTFNHIYKRGHTNCTCYMLGIVAAYCVYQLQKSNFDITVYKKYRPIYYALFPFGVSLILLGSIFFIDGFMPPTILRVSYFGCTKLLYGLIGVAFTVGTVFKYEKVYRGVLEWRGWAVTGRISYCAYLLHILFIRTFAGLMVNLVHASFYEMFVQYLGLNVITFAAALPLWMMVESPVGQLVKAVMSPSLDSKTNVTQTEDEQKKNEYVSRV